MSIVIYAIAIVLWVLLFLWTWNSARSIESNERKAFIVLGGIFIIGLITLIIFNISKSSVQYPNIKMITPVRRTMLAIFTPINGFIVMPYLLLQMENLKLKKINELQFKKRIFIFLTIFLVMLIFESSYLSNIQKGILSIYTNGK